MKKSKGLSKIESRKSVYLAPDRTKEEREFYSQLTKEMKTKMEADPGHYYFIRDRKICQVDRRPPDVSKD